MAWSWFKPKADDLLERTDEMNGLKTRNAGCDTDLNSLLREANREEPECIKVPVHRLNYDLTYQRDLSQRTAWISKTAHDWSDIKCGTIVVNRRPDGSLWVVDGAGRSSAKRVRFPSEETMIWCFVVQVPVEQEPVLFEAINKQRKPLQHRAMVPSRLRRRDPVWLGICDTLTATGFSLQTKGTEAGTRKDWKQINATQALESIYTRGVGGPALLQETLRFIRHAWYGEENSTLPATLQGVADFISDTNGHPLTLEKDGWKQIAAKFHRIPLEDIRREAASKAASMPGPERFSEAMFSVHNNRNKTPFRLSRQKHPSPF